MTSLIHEDNQKLISEYHNYLPDYEHIFSRNIPLPTINTALTIFEIRLVKMLKLFLLFLKNNMLKIKSSNKKFQDKEIRLDLLISDFKNFINHTTLDFTPEPIPIEMHESFFNFDDFDKKLDAAASTYAKNHMFNQSIFTMKSEEVVKKNYLSKEKDRIFNYYHRSGESIRGVNNLILLGNNYYDYTLGINNEKNNENSNNAEVKNNETKEILQQQ